MAKFKSAPQPKFAHTQVMAPPIKGSGHGTPSVSKPFVSQPLAPTAPGKIGLMPKTGGKGSKC